MKYVGIDVSAHFHVVAIIPDETFKDGPKSWRAVGVSRIENSRESYEWLVGRLGPPGGCVVGLEPTGYYYSLALAEFLAGRGYNVFWVDGKMVHGCRERFFKTTSKSDAIDARVIAAMLYYHQEIGEDMGINPASVELESQAAAIRALALQHWSLTKDKTRTINRLRQLLVAVFPEGERAFFAQLSGTAKRKEPPPVLLCFAPAPVDLLDLTLPDLFNAAFPQRKSREKVLDLAGRTIGANPGPYRDIIMLLAYQLDGILDLLRKVTGLLERRVEAHPYGELILSIPSSGHLDAAWIIGTIGDIDLYPSNRKLRKAMGCYVEDAQSGETVKGSRAGRSGSRNAKRALTLWAMRLLKANAEDNPIRDLYERRRRAGRKNNLAACRGRLVEVIWSVLHNRRPFRYNLHKGGGDGKAGEANSLAPGRADGKGMGGAGDG